MFDLNAAGLQSGVWELRALNQGSSHTDTTRTGRNNLVFPCLGSDGAGKFSPSLGKKGDGCSACDVPLRNTTTALSLKLLNWHFLFCMNIKGEWSELGVGWWGRGDKTSLLNVGNVPNTKVSCIFTFPGNCGEKCVSSYLHSCQCMVVLAILQAMVMDDTACFFYSSYLPPTKVPGNYY